MTLALGLIASLALVVANGFFVATEFAVARIRSTQVNELVEQGRPGAPSLRHAVDNLDAYLAACQLGITISSIGLGIVGEPVFEAALRPIFDPLGDYAHAFSFGFAFAIITLLHVVLGELAPKSLAIAVNVRTALVIAPVMRIFYVSARPFIDFFNFLGNLVLKPFGVPPAREVGHAPHSEDELMLLLEQSLAEGLIDADEREYAENIFEFGERRARQIMVPRPDIVYVTTADGPREAAERALKSGHTRLPLGEAEGGLDAVIGLVNAKDLLRVFLDGGNGDLRSLARPVKLVSESTLIDELMLDLRSERQHIALVVDEHGTTIGLVTLEDILEEIVGEIEDEFDVESEAGDLITPDGDDVLVKGAAPIHLVADQLGLEIEDPDEATIGGHVLELLGRIPKLGEVIDVDGRRVEVTAVDDTRVMELRFLATAPGDY